MEQHLSEIIIVITFPLSAAAIFITMLLTRHKQRMLMIEKGTYDPQSEQTSSPSFRTVKFGFIMISLSLALLLGLVIQNLFPGIEPLSFFIPILLCVGSSLILYYVWESKQRDLGR